MYFPYNILFSALQYVSCVSRIVNNTFLAGIRSKDRYIFSEMTLFWGDFEFVGSSQIIERGQWYFLWKIHSIKTEHNRPLRPRHYWFWNLKNWKIPKQNSSSSYESVTPNKIIKQQLTSNTDLNNWDQGGTTTFIVNVIYYGTFLYFSLHSVQALGQIQYLNTSLMMGLIWLKPIFKLNIWIHLYLKICPSELIMACYYVGWGAELNQNIISNVSNKKVSEQNLVKCGTGCWMIIRTKSDLK